MKTYAALLILALCPVLAAAPTTLPASLRTRIEGARSPALHWPDWHEHRTEVLAFYRLLDGHLAWSQGGIPTGQARALAARLAAADLKGLRASDYDGDRWTARMAALGTEVAQEDFDVAFTVCVLRYASALDRGRVDPVKLGQAPRGSARPGPKAAFLAELAAATDPGARLDSLEPHFQNYVGLLAQVPRYLALAQMNLPAIPAGRNPAPGRPYPGAAALATLLTALGDLSAEEAKGLTPGHYDAALGVAVQRFQLRHGLAPDGRLGARTLAQLNTPMAQRLDQLRLTLERWRWVALDPAQRLIWVNLPAFNLAALAPAGEGFKWELTMPVVVGGALEHETHVLTSKVNGIVFRPQWNVPASIVKHDILPALRHNPRYLARNGYELVRYYEDPGPVVPVSPKAIRSLAAGKLQLRQPPGKDNALGLVKITFPNNQDLYLHDSPAKAAFARTRRDVSHGCIRVQQPAELVAWILREDPAWDLDKVKAAMAADGPSRKVPVAAKVQVMLVYGTATVDGAGKVYFYQDLYGDDQELRKALDAGYP